MTCTLATFSYEYVHIDYGHFLFFNWGTKIFTFLIFFIGLIFGKFQSIAVYIGISLHIDLIAKFGAFPKNLQNILIYFEYTKLYFTMLYFSIVLI